MTLFTTLPLPARVFTVRPLIFMAFLVAGCSSLVFQLAPVVPTNSPLPYSAKVKLSQVEAYMVKPGATMIADPHIENHVTGVSNSSEAPSRSGRNPLRTTSPPEKLSHTCRWTAKPISNRPCDFTSTLIRAGGRNSITST